MFSSVFMLYLPMNKSDSGSVLLASMLPSGEEALDPEAVGADTVGSVACMGLKP